MVGLALTAVSGVYWAGSMFQSVSKIQRAVKPSWWLIVEARSGNAVTAHDALMELAERCQRGSLSPGQVRQLAIRLLATDAAVWPGQFAQVIMQRALKDGQITDAEWQVYCLQQLPLSLALRKTIRRGDPLPMAIVEDWVAPRGPPGSGDPTRTISLTYTYKASSLDVGGIACPPPNLERSVYWHTMGTKGWGSGDGVATLPADLLARLKDGPNDVTLWVSGQLNGINARLPFKASFQLLSRDARTITCVVPAEHRSAVHDAFSSVLVVMPPWDRGQANVYLPGARLPVPVAAKVFIRKAEKEWAAGVYCSDAMMLNDALNGCYPDVRVGDKVDVVLKPDPETAVKTVWVTEIWGEEIVIKDVVVRDRH